MLSLIFRILQTLLSLASTVTTILKTVRAIEAQQKKDSETLQSVEKTVEQILDAITPGPAVGFIFTANLEGQITTGVTQMQLKDTQQVILSIQPVDKKGNPAQVDGVPVWASSNTEVVTITAADDGLSATAVAVGPLGSAKISVTADADTGSGVTEIAGSIDIDVVASAATTVTITAGTPTDQQ